MRIAIATLSILAGASSTLASPHPHPQQRSGDRQAAANDNNDGLQIPWKKVALWGTGIATTASVGGWLALRNRGSSSPSSSSSSASAVEEVQKRPVMQRKDFEKLLPKMRSILNSRDMARLRIGVDGLSWGLTDPEIMDWMQCVVDNVSRPSLLTLTGGLLAIRSSIVAGS